MENVYIAEIIALLVSTILLLLVQLAYLFSMAGPLMTMVVVLFVMINAGSVILTILQCVFSANICSTWMIIQVNVFLANNIAWYVAAHRTVICV